MSAVLLDAALAHVRASFSRAQVAEVRSYGGEFSGDELQQIAFRCPAILLTVLGWRPEHKGPRLTGRFTRQVRMAAFVVSNLVDREKRMSQAMQIAEALCIALRTWAPDSTGLPMLLAGLDDDPHAENLYGRAVDAKGLALWLVDWRQDVKPVLELPQLFDLVAVDITDHTVQGGGGASASLGNPITVTEDVQFNTLPPAV